MNWTPELISEVRSLATHQGLSAAEIARQMGNGITKNSVVSLAYRVRPRIKLTGGPSMMKPKKSKAASALPVPIGMPSGRLKFFIIEEVFEPVHHDDLRRGDRRCRMPLWPDRIGSTEKTPRSELMYCGKKTDLDSSWCSDCRKRVYMPAIAKAAGPGSGRKVNRDGRRAGWQYGT